MSKTSGTYNFLNSTAESFVREAFERIGILPDLVVSGQLKSGVASLNFLLADWAYKGVNLWTINSEFLALIPGQATYLLPNNINNIYQAKLRLSSRVLIPDGIAQSNKADTYDNDGGGIPDAAFDGNSSTFCEQEYNDGNISYDFTVETPQIINFVGIQSNVDRVYNIVIEATNNSDDDNWTLLSSLGSLPFVKGINQWFSLNNINAFEFYRIREIGGVTLEIQEIYFNNNVSDYVLGEVSKSEMFTFSNPFTLGRPSVYFFDRQIAPKLTLYVTPSSQYNCLIYSASRLIEDTGLVTNKLDIPPQFYPALVSGLAWLLSMKYAPEKVEMHKAEYEQAFGMASARNTEDLPIRLEGNWRYYD